jgi:hypothetical protein
MFLSFNAARFCLWGDLKEKTYKDKFGTLNNLKKAVSQTVNNKQYYSQNMCNCVALSLQVAVDSELRQ